MNTPLRLTTALLLALAMVLLALCAPALAQTGPTSSQYVGESPETFTENAGPGTDAVNDAMSGTASSASPSASEEASVSPEGATSSGGAEGDTQAGSAGAADADTGKGSDSITELPETGGTPLAALGSGILLVTFGLMARRLVGR